MKLDKSYTGPCQLFKDPGQWSSFHNLFESERKYYLFLNKKNSFFRKNKHFTNKNKQIKNEC